MRSAPEVVAEAPGGGRKAISGSEAWWPPKVAPWREGGWLVGEREMGVSHVGGAGVLNTGRGLLC